MGNNRAATALGRRGGKRKVPKGFARMTVQKMKEIQQLALDARRTKKKDLTVSDS
jgi:hypothetical protein